MTPDSNLTMDKPDDPITVQEIAIIARKNLDPNVWNYYECGADEEQALDRNIRDFDKLLIRPRVMVDVQDVDTSTWLFGTKYPFPIGFAPSAMQMLAGGKGEIDVAAVAKKMKVNLTLSSQSTCSLEDVVHEAGLGFSSPDLWHQIYLTRDLEQSIPLIRRAEAAGYKALVVTVDTPVLGNRWNERKVPLVLPSHLRLANIEPPPSPNQKPKTRKPTFNRLLMDARTAEQAHEIVESAGASMHSSSITWEKTMPWLRKATKMKIILKGVMTAEDALLAVEYGADGILVSNHGGRQLDSAPSTVEALPEIVHEVKGRIPIIFDGGVRRGSDVFKAVALGADFVLIGRPVLYGLGYKGQEGVEAVVNVLERELSRTMALAGVTEVSKISRGSLGISRRDTIGVSKL